MARNRLETCSDARSRREASDSLGQIQERCILRRYWTVLLQEKNFGPNVIYYVSRLIDISSEVGGVGSSLDSPPNREIVSFRSCVRCEAACARRTMLLPRLGGGSSQNAPRPPARRRALVPVPCPVARPRAPVSVSSRSPPILPISL